LLDVAAAAAAVTLTLHPGQTLHITRLHVGDAFVCRTAAHAIRWKATATNLAASGSYAWDKRLQLNIARQGSGITVSCERR
jgi:hypothetical protein